MPGVQTFLPLLLDHVAAGLTTLQRVIDLTSAGPQRVFGLVTKGRIATGYDADFSVVDLKKRWTIEENWLATRCGWSPFTGMELTGKPIRPIITWHRVMLDDHLAHPAISKAVRFGMYHLG